ncbi:MAG: NERD domain-containing protein, partial [Clostridia bacterium]|nr:NERD domain-containing protein [Clostridia bacterium]
MDTRRVYENLTSVNIEEQKRLWDSRGKGYYGEYLVFNALYHNIFGKCKFLMNIEIPSTEGNSTELDLLMIHETGLYVFEIKHYQGAIYGTYQDETWTQYFRTQANSHFYNPIKQNDYHRAFLRKMFPGMPVYSAVVFTNNDATLHVTGRGNSDVVLCSYRGLFDYINDINSLQNKSLSEEGIDGVFKSLQEYSP